MRLTIYDMGTSKNYWSQVVFRLEYIFQKMSDIIRHL